MEVNKNGGENFIKENENLKKKLLNLSYKEFKIMTSFKKSREIPIKEYSLSGSIVSIKNNEIIEFESSLERDFICLIEFDTDVIKYCHQPIKIYFNDDKNYYVPDFYVEYRNGKKEVIEIKYSDDILVNHDLYKNKFKAAKEFCQKNGITFKILTEIDVRNEYLENVKFLLRYSTSYRHGGVIPINSAKDIELIKTKIRALKSSTPNLLLSSITDSLEKRAELLYLIWYLVLINEIKTDLKIKLTMNSKIWI